MESLYLREQLFDELLAIAVEGRSDDVGEVVEAVLRELRVREGRYGLLKLLEEVEEGVREGVEPE